MHKNSYLSAESSQEERLVLEALQEMPPIRNKDKKSDELFAKTLNKLTIEERANIFLLCVYRGHVS